MTGRMKKRIVILLLLACVLLPLRAYAGEYRELSVGMTGADVEKLKKAMYWLGYFNSLNLDDHYSETTARRVKQLQKNNGLEQTGVADPALQELVFSGKAVKAKNAPRPSPTPEPPPTPGPTPRPTPEGMPDSVTEEYVWEDSENGLWIYQAAGLSIVINRYETTLKKNAAILWYEADIRCSPEEPLRTWLTEGRKTPGTAFKNPLETALKNRAVLAFCDDHYGDRRSKDRVVGVIIRNGVVYSDKTRRGGSSAFPNLDVLAVFQDGSMKTFVSDAHTAQEYLDMGVLHTYAFGPILVQDGQLSEGMLQKDRYTDKAPRCALGMIEPWHYYLVVVKGQSDDSQGVTVPWVAQRMLEAGVQEALNLDGGGTATLMFMGKLLNRRTAANLRDTTSISGFGSSELVTGK